MKTSRFTESQIINILNPTKAARYCRIFVVSIV